MIKWLENYWYHYKWHTIIALFFVLVVVICTIQLATKESYDAYITFIGNTGSITQTDYQDILNSTESIAKDYNNDGKISINFNRELYISDSDNEYSSSINQNITTFMQSYMYGDCYIFFIDPVLYEAYKDSGMFVALSSYLTDIPAEMMNDEMSVKLSETEFYNKLGISSIPEDTLIVLKTVPYVGSNSKKAKMEELQNNHVDLLQAIVDMGIHTD